jgi:hypothetical protein
LRTEWLQCLLFKVAAPNLDWRFVGPRQAGSAVFSRGAE